MVKKYSRHSRSSRRSSRKGRRSTRRSTRRQRGGAQKSFMVYFFRSQGGAISNFMASQELGALQMAGPKPNTVTLKGFQPALGKVVDIIPKFVGNGKTDFAKVAFEKYNMPGGTQIQFETLQNKRLCLSSKMRAPGNEKKRIIPCMAGPHMNIGTADLATTGLQIRNLVEGNVGTLNYNGISVPGMNPATKVNMAIEIVVDVPDVAAAPAAAPTA
jgi:hypothetical protein